MSNLTREARTMNSFKKKRIVFTIFLLLFTGTALAQKPYRVGTTAADFLEIGYGTAGVAMGDAYVSMTNDLASVYWNPAGLSFMRQSEAQFMYQPWLIDTSTLFTGVGLVFPRYGTIAVSLFQADYGEMEVTNMDMQDGTGELFGASDYAVTLSYGRKLAQWFAFGASFKYVASQIWHSNAHAMAFDLGVIVKTHFFSPTGEKTDGMNIGMSICNYGTKMRYDGIDLLHPIDIAPNEGGNYRDVRGKFDLESWELPLIFRIGTSVYPLVTANQRLSLEIDGLHPNNNSESINLGAQYQVKMPGTGEFFLRVGYKGLFMDQSQYGFAFGAGMHLFMMNNMGMKLEYAYRGVGILGKTYSYSVAFLF